MQAPAESWGQLSRAERRRSFLAFVTTLVVAALCVLVLAPTAYAQTDGEAAELETCGYLNVVLTASGPVAVEAATSLKSELTSELSDTETAALDEVIADGDGVSGDGADELKARQDADCDDLDLCPLIDAINADDMAAASAAAATLRNISQPVPPSVALALRDMVEADPADEPFTTQRQRINEYFSNEGCDSAPATGGSGDSATPTATPTTDGSGEATPTPAPTATTTPSTGGTPSATATPAGSGATAGSDATATPTPAGTNGGSSPTATPTASVEGAQLPNTGIGSSMWFLGFAAAALVAGGAWLIELPTIRR